MSIPITPALAEWLKAAMGDLTHDEIHDEMGGPSSPTLTKITNNEGGTISRKSAKLLEHVFGLPRGRVAAIARGEHVPGDEPAAQPSGPLTAGDLIGAVRRARGWTHFEMAAELQVSEPILREWERGTIPIDRRVLEAIERLLAAGRSDVDFQGRRAFS